MTQKKRRKRGKKHSYHKGVFLCLLIIGLIILSCFILPKDRDKSLSEPIKDMYLASSNPNVSIFQLVEEKTSLETTQEEKVVRKLIEVDPVVRGTKIKTNRKEIQFENKTYQLIKMDDKEYYVEKNNLVKNLKDAVLEKSIFVRTATGVLENSDSSKIVGLATKGTELEVVSYDYLKKDGTVHLYQINLDDIKGYVYGTYMTDTKEEAMKNYDANVYDAIHSKVKNTYGGGEAIQLDFYPNIKPEFSNNKMPDSVYALYLNCSSSTIQNIDSYIEFARDTKINAFVVDIKDNESPAYPAKIFKTLSPTNYKHAMNSYESYKNAITKLKEAGFYVIGRITTFKDSYYVEDHPEQAIMNKSTNTPYLHNGSYWPSAYHRDVWYYTVSLAKEAVKEFGFNEINFDYVRFPDRMNRVSDQVDLRNTYQEDKTQAIQRFVQYAKDILHELNVYVSIDVFGETTNSSYTTAYGQYWPAISNVADVISGMPYPDHFSNGSYGLQKPWNQPYQLMNYWGSYASDRQKEAPTPAKVRTWIQAYDVMKYVDANGITYGAKELEQEIRGLYESGLDGGYITWLSNSNLEKYKVQEQAFQIDYRKEYLDEQKSNSE